MQKIEPTYLRYVYDGLSKGSISSNNPTSLPIGFIGLFEDEFPSSMPLGERMSLLNRLALCALLKGPVSIEMISDVLNEDPDSTKALIDTYSKWFNSPDPGKYVLFHDRLRTYLLQKLSNHEVQDLNEKLISYLENVIHNGGLLEAESYALEHLSTHLYIESALDEKNLDRLFNFTNDENIWKRQINLSNEYKWSQKGIKLAMKESARQKAEKKLIHSCVNSLSLVNDEKNNAKQIIDLVVNGHFEQALSRLEIFNKEELTIIILLIIHELTIGSLKQSPQQLDFLKKIIDYFKKNTDCIVPYWYPKILVLKYQLILHKIGLINIIDEKTNVKDSINFFENKMLATFWGFIVDDEFNYINDRIELIQYASKNDDINEEYFPSFFKKINEDENESDVFINIKSFKGFNFTEFNNDDFIPYNDSWGSGYDKQIYFYLYCGYRYLILSEEIIPFIDKSTNKILKNNIEAAICSLSKAFNLISEIKEVPTYYNEISENAYHNFKQEKFVLLLKTLSLFKGIININTLQRKVIQHIIDNDYLLFDNSELTNRELCSNIFNFYLENEEYEKCIEINSLIMFSDFWRGNYGLIYNNSKEDDLVCLANKFYDTGNTENYNQVLELIETDFAKTKTLLFVAESKYVQNLKDEGRKILFDCFNTKFNHLFHFQQIRINVIDVLLKFKEHKNSILLIDHYIGFVKSQTNYEWATEQYVFLIDKLYNYELYEKAKEPISIFIKSIDLVDRFRMKEAGIISFLNLFLKYNKIDEFFINENLFKLSEKASIEMLKSISVKINIDLAIKYAELKKINIYLIPELYSKFDLDKLISIYNQNKSLELLKHITSKLNQPDDYRKIIIRQLSQNKPEYAYGDDDFYKQGEYKIDNLKSLFNVLLIENRTNSFQFELSVKKLNPYLNSLIKEFYNKEGDYKRSLSHSNRVIALAEKIIIDNLFRRYLEKSLNKQQLILQVKQTIDNIEEDFDHNGFFGSKKVMLIVYVSNAYEQIGFLDEAFDLTTYSEELSDINKKTHVGHLSDLILFVFENRLLKIASNFGENKFKIELPELIKRIDLMDIDTKFEAKIELGISIIHKLGTKEGLTYLRDVLIEFLNEVPFTESEYEIKISSDIREEFLNEFIDIALRFSKVHNNQKSVLKVQSDKNEKLWGSKTKVEPKYDENSIISEYSRLINISTDNISLVEFVKFRGEHSTFINVFEDKLIFALENRTIKIKSFEESITSDINFENQLYERFLSKEYFLVNNIFKIDSKYYFIPEKESFKEFEELVYIDFLELKDWGTNFIFSYFIKHVNNNQALTNLLFFKLKEILFVEKTIDYDLVYKIQDALMVDSLIKLSLNYNAE